MHSLLSVALSFYFCEEIRGFVSFPLMNSMGEASQHSPHVITSVQAQNNPLIDPKRLFTTSSFIMLLKYNLLEARWEFGKCHWIFSFFCSVLILVLGQLLLPHLRARTDTVPVLHSNMDITYYAEPCIWKDRHFLKRFRSKISAVFGF